MQHRTGSVHDYFAGDARTVANFYSLIADLIEGDGDQDDGFKFLAELYQERDRIDAVRHLEHAAVARVAGVLDREDIKDPTRYAVALADLIRRVGKLGLTPDEIDARFADDEDGDERRGYLRAIFDELEKHSVDSLQGTAFVLKNGGILVTERIEDAGADEPRPEYDGETGEEATA